MKPGRMKQLAEVLIGHVKEYVSRELAKLPPLRDAFAIAIQSGFKGTEQDWLASLRGERGQRGEPGERGSPGQDGAPGAAGPAGQAGPAGALGATGERGAQGARGEQGPAGPKGEKGDQGAAGARGEAGPQGEKGAPGAVGPAGVAGKDGMQGPQGLTGERGERGEVGVEGKAGRDGREGKDGRDGRPGEDGAPGRDALALEILPGIDEQKSYPRGTFAEYRGGMIRAVRNTDPIKPGLLSESGWAVCLNGIAEELEQVSEDGRAFKRTTVYTDGRMVNRELKIAAMLYRGVWREGEYERGDVVTWGGSAFHCEVEKTTGKPEESKDWKLMVKRGQNGRDGAPSAQPAPAGQVRVK